MSAALHIKEFLKEAQSISVLDVRTPAEFEQGHIPGAINMPLFSNEERAIVGTIYKREGRQAAIVKGLEFVGPKMAAMVVKAQEHAKNNTIAVHCWRGGMRSGSVGWLLQMYGLNVFTLKGGYKQFRKLVLENFAINAEVKILGGRTGAAKTQVLHYLSQKNEAVLDIEALACHKGSAFGGFGQTQPTQEQFENELYIALEKLKQAKRIWIEDESRHLGKKMIPLPIWEKMRAAAVEYIDIPFDVRAEKLLKEYGVLPKDQLEKAINGIARRMGPEKTGQTLAALHQDDLVTVCKNCLEYYDKSYDHALQKREHLRLKKYTFRSESPEEIAEALIKANDDRAQTH